MKNEEFYRKWKVKDDFFIRPIIMKSNWWSVVLITLLIISIEPIVMMEYRKLMFISLAEYFNEVLFFSKIIIPVEVLVLWFPRLRHMIVQRRGFDWIGRFEVVGKVTSFRCRYITLSPGHFHRIKADASLYHKTNIGDYLIVRRNVLGDVKEVVRSSHLRENRGPGVIMT